MPDCPHAAATGGFCDGCGEPQCWCWAELERAPCPIHDTAAAFRKLWEMYDGFVFGDRAGGER